MMITRIMPIYGLKKISLLKKPTTTETSAAGSYNPDEPTPKPMQSNLEISIWMSQKNQHSHVYFWNQTFKYFCHMTIS